MNPYPAPIYLALGAFMALTISNAACFCSGASATQLSNSSFNSGVSSTMSPSAKNWAREIPKAVQAASRVAWAAEIVLALRDEGASIRLICASPYKGFESRWSRTWQERYQKVMEQANLVRFICPDYSRDCFRQRNKWMVDHSARVIALYNGQPGGTKNTVDYAKQCGVPLVILK